MEFLTRTGQLVFGDRLQPNYGVPKVIMPLSIQPTGQEVKPKEKASTSYKEPVEASNTNVNGPKEDISFTKVSRGERIRTFDFLLPKQAR